MERRIDLSGSKPSNEPLKQIAGLMQKLSYRDMTQFGAKFQENLKEASNLNAVVEALLQTSETILKPELTTEAMRQEAFRPSLTDRASQAVYRG